MLGVAPELEQLLGIGPVRTDAAPSPSSRLELCSLTSGLIPMVTGTHLSPRLIPRCRAVDTLVQPNTQDGETPDLTGGRPPRCTKVPGLIPLLLEGSLTLLTLLSRTFRAFKADRSWSLFLSITISLSSQGK